MDEPNSGRSSQGTIFLSSTPISEVESVEYLGTYRRDNRFQINLVDGGSQELVVPGSRSGGASLELVVPEPVTKRSTYASRESDSGEDTDGGGGYATDRSLPVDAVGDSRSAKDQHVVENDLIAISAHCDPDEIQSTLNELNAELSGTPGPAVVDMVATYRREDEINQSSAKRSATQSSGEGGTVPEAPMMSGSATAVLSGFQESLETEGVCVIPTDLVDQDLRQAVNHALDDEIREKWTTREYKEDAFGEHPWTDEVTPLVGGGFAALGNPSSFHGTVVRKLRQVVHNAVELRMPFQLKRGQYVSQVIDRLLKRCLGQVPSKESWHRDIATNTEEGAIVYGGWLNLDDTPQKFSCVLGTHKDAIPEDAKSFYTLPKDADVQKKTRAISSIVTIPPGCMLIFNEKLIHEVYPARAQSTMKRLFTGWYISKSEHPLDPVPEEVPLDPVPEEDPLDPVPEEVPRRNPTDALLQRLDNNDVMPLKSGQRPQMIPNLWWVNNPQLIEPLTSHLRDEATAQRPRNPTAKYPKPNPAEYRCPFRREDVENQPKPLPTRWFCLSSLRTLRASSATSTKPIQLWEPYTTEQVRLLRPMTAADLTKFRKDVEF